MFPLVVVNFINIKQKSGQGSYNDQSLILYMLHSIMRKYNISYHSYADDTLLYISLFSNNLNPVNKTVKCILNIESWLSRQLNSNNPEVLAVDSQKKRERQNTVFTCRFTVSKVTSLRVILSAHLNFESHDSNITRAAF